MSSSAYGATREDGLIQIVSALALLDGHHGGGSPLGLAKGTDRAWISEAFAFARDCLDGPPKP